MDTDSTLDGSRAVTQSMDTVPVVTEVVDTLGNVVTRRNVAYSCTSVPYTLERNPRDIVIYNPDVDILARALIQGKSHKSSVGSSCRSPSRNAAR